MMFASGALAIRPEGRRTGVLRRQARMIGVGLVGLLAAVAVAGGGPLRALELTRSSSLAFSSALVVTSMGRSQASQRMTSRKTRPVAGLSERSNRNRSGCWSLRHNLSKSSRVRGLSTTRTPLLRSILATRQRYI